ncbi:MAG: substrate-binding domain-containing protein, partial [Actinomycetota bacterium]
GHESVAHLAGPGDWLESRARARGWRRALRRSGHRGERRTAVVLGEGDWSARSGYEIGRSMLRGPHPTAIFAANDQMALGLLRAVDEAGLRAPQDISVVGFDDVPEAAFFTPPLTTVHQDFFELGRRAMDLIARALDGDAAARTTSVAPVLVVRASTGPPSSRSTARR